MLYYILIPILIVFFALVLVFKRGKKAGKKLNNLNGPFEILEIQVPKNDEETHDVNASALAAENMFASLHGLLREDYHLQEHFSFEIASEGGSGIKFYVVVPVHVLKFIESQIYAQYPTAQVKVATDYTSPEGLSEGFLEIGNLSFSRELFYPIKTFRDFETDPLSAITSALSDVNANEQIWLQYLVKPMPDIWQKEGYTYVTTVRTGVPERQPSFVTTVAGQGVKELTQIVSGVFTKPFVSDTLTDKKFPERANTSQPRLSATQDLELKSIENKLSKMGFEVQIRIFSHAINPERAQSNLRSVVASLKQFSTSTLNALTYTSAGNKISALEEYRNRLIDSNKTLVLNVEELATVFHLPSAGVETPNISWLYSKKSEPPSTLPVKDCTYIGETIFRSQRVKFGMANTDDRLRHMYVIGKSGTGKSTLFETMIAQDIKNGEGVGVLDPHGETIDKILDHIPDERIDDVIYFDPSDIERPIGLNLLEMEDQSQKNLMASALVAAIKHNFDYSWGPRLEYLLNYAILTLLEVPGTTMLGITRLMEDDNYQKYILHQVKDPVVVKFWEQEFKQMKGNQKLVTEAIAPIQNKVNRFLASTTIRNILGQKKSSINIADAMNNGKILLINLSKGKIGSDNSNLLGALLVSRIQFMALQRAKIPYAQRKPFYLYVDEFQNFASGSFEEILSESRKYKLGLYLTHQFTGQLPEDLLKSVFGNVGTIATFALGAPDAKVLANEFAPYFEQNDIISLDRFNIYVKLMIDGMTSLPFSARILLPWEDKSGLIPTYDNKQKVLDRSREKYGVDREGIESRINKWVETPFDKGMAIAQEIKDKQKAQQPSQPPQNPPLQPEKPVESTEMSGSIDLRQG